MNQMAISFVERTSFARRLGDEAGNRCADKAEAKDPAFRQRALDFIVAYVRQQGEVRGEDVTHAAVLAGIKPDDARAFGPIYKAAIKQGLIRVVGYVPRVRGHGSMGGKLYRAGAAG
ncbi:hypothetical protein [Variovorax saccharolyticus]|uniref:hypothetical protein n=1 Tax=Variovorax saccharolyticus TaxID=3053516 RepID=UPI0025777BB8|nr:hypothetical protein [Variovorax sp. J31P216]MDM0024103.1 hypothetical protein [Variovorax sp. J31P216]